MVVSAYGQEEESFVTHAIAFDVHWNEHLLLLLY
jgi:hypothetical protein